MAKKFFTVFYKNMNTITNFNNNYNNNLQPKTNNIAFKCINIKDEDVVKKKYGEGLYQELLNARRECAKYHWELNIDKNGCSLSSPTVCKTYTGPFSLKKHKSIL